MQATGEGPGRSDSPFSRTVGELASHTVYVEECREALLAICEVIPLQFLSCWMAVNNGIDVDYPRNLTKAVLAE